MSYDAYDTRADLEAVAVLPPAYAYVGEVDAVYKYDAGSVATPDDWVILASAAGGNYIANSAELLLPAIGTGSDDWVNFAAAAASTATAGKRLRFGAGTYYCQTSQLIPSNAHIVLNPLTNVECAITPVNNLDAPFTLEGINIEGDTLAADTNIGDMSFVITGLISSFAVGDYVVLYDRQYRAAHYLVKGWNAGTKTVTIERPLRMAHGGPTATASFPSGSQIFKTSITQNVRIDFNGAHIYGQCSRFIELILARKCNFYGPVYCGDGSSTTAVERVISIDESCFDCHAHQIYADGGGTTDIGTSFEAAEASTFNRCEMYGMAITGHLFQDGIDCVVHEQVNHNNVGTGANFSAAADNDPPTGAGSVWGSQNCRIVGGSNSRNTTGVLLERGSSYCTVDAVSIFNNNNGIQEANLALAEPAPGYYNKILGNTTLRLNTGNGVSLTSDTNYFLATECIINNNGNGFQSGAGSTNVGISNSRLDDNTGITVVAASTMTMMFCGGKPVSSNTNAVVFQANAGTIVDALATTFSSNNASANTFQTAGTLQLVSGRVIAPSTGTCVYGQTGSTTYISMATALSGAGSSGSSLKLQASARAFIAQGASVPNYSVRCTGTSANSTQALNTNLGFSFHIG